MVCHRVPSATWSRDWIGLRTGRPHRRLIVPRAEPCRLYPRHHLEHQTPSPALPEIIRLQCPSVLRASVPERPLYCTDGRSRWPWSVPADNRRLSCGQLPPTVPFHPDIRSWVRMTDRSLQVLARTQVPPVPRFRRSSRTSLWSKEFRRSCQSFPPTIGISQGTAFGGQVGPPRMDATLRSPGARPDRGRSHRPPGRRPRRSRAAWASTVSRASGSPRPGRRAPHGPRASPRAPAARSARSGARPGATSRARSARPGAARPGPGPRPRAHRQAPAAARGGGRAQLFEGPGGPGAGGVPVAIEVGDQRGGPPLVGGDGGAELVAQEGNGRLDAQGPGGAMGRRGIVPGQLGPAGLQLLDGERPGGRAVPQVGDVPGQRRGIRAARRGPSGRRARTRRR